MLGIKVVGQRLLVAAWLRGERVAPRPQDRCGRGPWTNNVWPDPTNLNDIAIAPNGDAYITDSERPVLYRIPAAELRHPSAAVQDLPVFLEWEDPPYSDYEPGFLEANGIVVTPDGKFLLVVHYSDGILFRVRLSDKQVRRVDLGGYRLISGDGMVLTDDQRPLRRSPLRLARRQVPPQRSATTRGRLLSETTDPTFHGPTTAAIAGDRLLVVNSQFTGPRRHLRGRCRASDFPDTV